MFKEFKAFAMRGNVVDMAVGIIIGAAFGKIIASLVSDILMPPIGMLMGGLSFSDKFMNLGDGTYKTLAAAKEAGAPVLAWGNFVDTIINFAIIAFALFMVIKQMNKLMPPPPPAASKTHDCPKCFSAIPLKASRCPACTSEVQPAKA